MNPSYFEAFFKPRGIAMIGASANPNKWGFRILANIIVGGFKGLICPVNPKGGTLLGLQVYPSVKTVPDLVDLVSHSDLVVSRAGYNTVNEILLTGVRAILIPETHGGGEQEMRARSICEDRIRVLTEEEVIENHPGDVILALLSKPAGPGSHLFDKYEIGRQIIEDLENWKATPRPCR